MLYKNKTDRLFLEESIKKMDDVDLKKMIWNYLNKEL